MTSRPSSARKRDYPTQRAVVTVKHIHQACGKWPNDGHTPVDDETHDEDDDDDDVADSEVIEANSEPADEIIALGLPKNRSGDKGDKQSEDHEVTVGNEVSAFLKRYHPSGNGTIEIQVDKPAEDTSDQPQSKFGTSSSKWAIWS
ncbi:hypothetical protein NW764_016474 [Fusarium oxysporum]|nr:hypothetical protein NW764_016474 [Fusarium oxysporum]